MKKLLVLLMSLLVAVTLTGCSSSSSNSAAGTYELTQVENGGVTITSDDELWKTYTSGMEATMTLENDGSCSVSLFGQTGEGTYEVDGSTVTITIEGDAQEFKLDGDQLSAELDGTKLIFEK